MKTLSRVFLICMLMVSTSLVVAQDGTSTGMGDFVVEKAEQQMTVNGELVETYVIEYENVENPIYVGIVNSKKCKDFIVRSNGFEIQYVCNKTKFGVCITEAKYATMNQREFWSKVNRSAFLHQRVISTSGPKPDAYQVKLIASYLPDVMSTI